MSGPFKNSVLLLATGVLMLGMQPQAHAQGQNDRRSNGGGARSQAGNGQRFRGPRMGTWLRENRGKSFDQQRQSLENDPDYKNLPPQRQEELKQRLQKFNSLPPEQQEKLLHRFDTLNHMSPQQRAQARALLDRMRVLPPERRAAIRQYFHNLVTMNRDQRQHVLGSSQFSNQFNPDERDIIQRGLELNDENNSQDVGEAPK
jgi:hypothetical protein